eukprot:239574_1
MSGEWQQIQHWLKEMGYENYIQTFEDNGYDDWEIINDASTQDFIDIGVKKGHAKKISKRKNINTTSNNNTTQYVRLCHYYNNCRFGNNCKFRHIDFELQSEVHMNLNYSNTQHTPIIHPIIDIPMQQPITTTTQYPDNQTTQTNTMHKINLSVFKDNQNVKCTNNNYKQCKSMKRLLVALKFYSTLNILQNDTDAEIFREFMHDI